MPSAVQARGSAGFKSSGIPGQLADIARLIADAGGNVLEVSHDRMMPGITAKFETLELVPEARDTGHAQEIRERLAANRFRQL
jgi:threonine dehydratase